LPLGPFFFQTASLEHALHVGKKRALVLTNRASALPEEEREEQKPVQGYKQSTRNKEGEVVEVEVRQNTKKRGPGQMCQLQKLDANELKCESKPRGSDQVKKSFKRKLQTKTTRQSKRQKKIININFWIYRYINTVNSRQCLVFFVI
jgi:hypothetical protein